MIKQYAYLLGGIGMIIIGVSVLVSQQFISQSPKSLTASLGQSTNITTMESETLKDRPVITMHTSKGDITIELFEDLSPKTVGFIQKFVEEGYYEGTLFHRVIPDFMIQGGDPLTKDMANKSRFGTGGPDFEFEDEFNDQPLVRGSVAMANSGPDTNGSQFFIVTADETPWLDGVHTNFGRVIGGMEVVDEISTLPTDSSDLPLEPVKIEKIEILKQ